MFYTWQGVFSAYVHYNKNEACDDFCQKNEKKEFRTKSRSHWQIVISAVFPLFSQQKKNSLVVWQVRIKPRIVWYRQTNLKKLREKTFQKYEQKKQRGKKQEMLEPSTLWQRHIHLNACYGDGCRRPNETNQTIREEGKEQRQLTAMKQDKTQKEDPFKIRQDNANQKLRWKV